MKRTAVLTIATFSIAAALLFITTAQGASGRHVLKIATLAPEGSAWMNLFEEINADIMQQTDNRVRFRVYAGGVLGDEADVLRKMFVGQIHGAVITASSLTRILPDMDVLQVPFLFQDYAEVDYLLSNMDAYFRSGMEKNGYVMLGWSEGGFVRLMSTVPVVTLDDLRKAKVWVWEEAPMTRAIFKEAGVSGIPLSMPDVLVGLQTGLVEVVYVPPAGAISLQWFTKTKYITDVPLMYITGVIIVKKSAFDQLSIDDQAIVRQSFDRQQQRMKKTVREKNRSALQVMTDSGIQLLGVSKEEIEKYKEITKRAIKQPGSTSFSEETLKRVETYLETFRRENP
jgi:TRAP-type C4-dicarboxylate transport system substrate-binding protein